MNFTKQCWSCGKETVFPIKNYYECTECGATYNELPPPSPFDLVEEPIAPYTRETKYRLSRKRGLAKSKGKR